MNYKRMWLILKKIVSEECGVFSWLDPENGDYFKGREDEANDILEDMEIIEKRVKEAEYKEFIRTFNEFEAENSDGHTKNR